MYIPPCLAGKSGQTSAEPIHLSLPLVHPYFLGYSSSNCPPTAQQKLTEYKIKSVLVIKMLVVGQNLLLRTYVHTYVCTCIDTRQV